MEDKDYNDFIYQLKEKNKANWLVQHIKEHLKEMNIDGKVLCKICDKDIDQIANEKIKEIMTHLNG